MSPHLPDEGPVLVVGAGVTGLTAAHLLAEAGVPVLVVERSTELGGLARSYRYGDFVFDVGPHRFHTENPLVTAYLERVLRDPVRFPRLSEVYFRGRYYRWPLHPRQLVQLPPGVALRSGLDLLLNAFREHRVRTFEDYVLRQYGPTLYAHFFKDYSEKFLGISPSETHPDWARAGINRAIIDDKLQMQNLTQLLRTTLFQYRRGEIDFLYPRGGMGGLWKEVASRIEELGGRLFLGRQARLEPAPGRVAAVWLGGERIPVSDVIWTGTVNLALTQLGLDPLDLPFRSLLLYNVMLKGTPARAYQWCYYGERELVFNRISIPRNFDPSTAPADGTGLCVEVTCMEGDSRWSQAERLVDWVLDDLQRVGMLPNREAVLDVRIEHVADSYPIYHVDYPRSLERARELLAPFRNLHMAGRNGVFWYNNMDHCIEAILGLVRGLLERRGLRVNEEALARGGAGSRGARA